MNIVLLISGFIATVILCTLIKPIRKKKNKDWQYQILPVSQLDIQILDKVLALLSDKSGWEPGSDRLCIKGTRQNLFCAIAFASQEITGKYEHWGPVTQEVRKTIEEEFPERWSEHPIMDFNGNPETSHKDILDVLEITRQRLIKRS